MAVGTMTAALVLQLTRPTPEPTLALTVPQVMTAPGTAPVLPWPAQGESAVSVPEAGFLQSSGPEAPVPVASLTKMMTAYLVLRDHPLDPAGRGPSITMTAADQLDAAADARANATSIPLVAGASYSERELLDALLVHSANDVADALARWDAGDASSFVAKMNATAHALGMNSTRYVDASGINAADVSTAADQLRLAGVAMTVPTFAAVVAQPAVAIPGAGLLSNYVPAVGTDGVVGVKSGFTQAAMGCVVLAAERPVAGRQVLVLAALTGQQGGADPIRVADKSAIALVDTVATGLSEQTLVPATTTLGRVSVPWDRHQASVTTISALDALVWPGTRWSPTVRPTSVSGRVQPGEQVATLVVSDGIRRFSVPLVTTAGLPGPSMHWRLMR
jgi:D-alanyl-D-alanine carboxypeptidase (penicillin-binding protein 5/6)